MTNDITAILVNYKTKALTEKALATFRQFYPDIYLILVDNHSRDESTEYVKGFSGKDHYKVILNASNIGHGPAMSGAISLVTTKYFLTLDSDIEVNKPFLAEMVKPLEANDALYAVGWLRWVDRISGVPLVWHVTPPSDRSKFIPYIHPYCGLYRLSTYKTLPQFFDHGAPCLDNMRVANERGIEVQDFPLGEYVKHWEAGTRRLFRGHWHPNDNERPDAWNPKQRFPI